MISYHNGDLLESGCEIIAHQVNLQGVMGGGLARQIATKYPSIENFYKEVIKEQHQLLGHFYGCKAKEDKTIGVTNKVFIANCFTQDYEFNTDYSTLKQCFIELKEWAINCNYETIGVPFKYGCGIAHGDWQKVEQIFKDLFENEPNIDFQIWKLGE